MTVPHSPSLGASRQLPRLMPLVKPGSAAELAIGSGRGRFRSMGGATTGAGEAAGSGAAVAGAGGAGAAGSGAGGGVAGAGSPARQASAASANEAANRTLKRERIDMAGGSLSQVARARTVAGNRAEIRGVSTADARNPSTEHVHARASMR